MKWNIGRPMSRRARKRRQLENLGWRAEICEERILLSATMAMARASLGPSIPAAAAAKGSAPSTTPKIVRDPSSGGPNGTSFLANDASTPPNWAQQQTAIVTPPLDSQVNSTTPALNEANLPVSGAFNVGSWVSLNGPPLAGNMFGSPTFGNIAFNEQSLTQSEANYSTSLFAFQSQTAGASSGQIGNPVENGLNGSHILNGLGETLPLPDLGIAPEQPGLDHTQLPNLDLAFLQSADTTSPLGW
jgi:hypothetical protein